MKFTTEPNGRYLVDTTDSEALAYLVIYPGQVSDIIIASFRGNPDLRYAYRVDGGQALENLVRLDSAGRFMATWVKKVAEVYYQWEETPVTV